MKIPSYPELVFKTHQDESYPVVGLHVPVSSKQTLPVVNTFPAGDHLPVATGVQVLGVANI